MATGQITLTDLNDGVSITSVDIEYASNTSSSIAPTAGWTTNAPNWVSGNYIWSRIVTTYSNLSTSTSNPVCLTGESGETGRGIASIVEEFYLSTSKTQQTGGSWSTTMPNWESGKYIWTRSLITYTSGTPATSTTEPLVSSEWEAANEVEDFLKDYIGSRGENLVTNGTGLLGTNYNFSSFTFDGVDTYGSAGSFKTSVHAGAPVIDELLPINPDLIYRMTYFVKANPYVGARGYGFATCYDVDKLLIQTYYTMYVPNTLTTLAQDLKDGDTVVYLTSANNWQNAAGVNTHLRTLIFWNYVNSYGYAYPELTYSRNHSGFNVWADGAIDYVNNTITLTSPWNKGLYAAGTKVSNGSAGGTYKYISGSNYIIPENWTKYTGTIGTTDYSGTNVTTKFHPGTSYVKIGWLTNRDIVGSTMWISNINFGLDITATTTGLLTNENHTVTANTDGTGYSLTTAGGSFKVYSGTTDVTAATAFSGTATKSGLTLTIASTGVYTLSGASWTSDSESFILTAIHNGVTITKSYTITKSKAGTTGTPASIYEVELDPPNIKRSKDGILTPSFLTIKSYKITGNATRELYAGRFKIYENGNSTAIYSSVANENSYTYTPSVTANHIKVELWVAGGFVTLLDTQSAVITNDATGGNLLYTNEWVETSSEITNTTFPHWGPVINLADEIDNNMIVSTLGPHENYVNTWRTTLLNTSNWAATYSKEFAIENTKTYRFTMWVKKEGIGEDLNGNVYIGTKLDGVCSLGTTDNTLHNNPYFYADSLPVLNEWLLFVGYIYPTTSQDISDKTEGGWYNIKGQSQGASTTNFKWPSVQSSSLFRFGYGYNTAQDLVYFYAPRVEICDGTELPLEAFFSISKLLVDTNTDFQNTYGTLNDDGIISSVEKRGLFEFWKELVNQVILLKNKASESRFIDEISLATLIDNFNLSYTLLYNYIEGDPESTNFPGLFLFNDLATDTPLSSLVNRESVEKEVVELLVDENIVMTKTTYWDKKWEDFYTAKWALEEEIRLIELNQYTEQQAELANLTSFQTSSEGTIRAIKEQIVFTTDGLIIREEDNPLSILVSHDRGIILYNGASELMILNSSSLTVNSINVPGTVTLGMHVIQNYTPTNKAPQTTIG